MEQHYLPKPIPLASNPDHLRAHHMHMRNVRFSQKRSHWTRLIRCIAAWDMRAARGGNFSDHEQRMFDAAKVELKLVEDQLDQMQAECEAEIAAEQEADAAAGKPSTEDVNVYQHIKRRTEEARAKTEKK